MCVLQQLITLMPPVVFPLSVVAIQSWLSLFPFAVETYQVLLGMGTYEAPQEVMKAQFIENFEAPPPLPPKKKKQVCVWCGALIDCSTFTSTHIHTCVQHCVCVTAPSGRVALAPSLCCVFS